MCSNFSSTNGWKYSQNSSLWPTILSKSRDMDSWIPMERAELTGRPS